MHKEKQVPRRYAPRNDKVYRIGHGLTPCPTVQFADRLVVAVMPLWLTPMVVVPVAKVVARPARTGALAMVATVGTVELQ